MRNEFSVALVEDSERDASTCREFLEKFAASRGIAFQILRYRNGELFLTDFHSQFDFIILDIELGDRNGVDVARIIRQADQVTVIMFVTEIAKYAAQGYEVSAIDYALKPLSYPSFSLKLDRVVRALNSRSGESITVKTSQGFAKISLDDTCYVEVYGHDVVFHLRDGDVRTYGTLKQFEKTLLEHHFLRCNACYLVNCDKIIEIAQYDITLLGGQTIKMSHPKRKEFMAGFKRYMLEKGN